MARLAVAHPQSPAITDSHLRSACEVPGACLARIGTRKLATDSVDADHPEITMSENTSISWTTNTFSPWWGCTRVSAGCALVRISAEITTAEFDVFQRAKETPFVPASTDEHSDVIKRLNKEFKVSEADAREIVELAYLEENPGDLSVFGVVNGCTTHVPHISDRVSRGLRGRWRRPPVAVGRDAQQAKDFLLEVRKIGMDGLDGCVTAQDLVPLQWSKEP